MIPRYTRPEMGKIWSDENKYNIWLEIELLACDANSEIGIIPKDIADTIRQKAKIDAKRIAEIEETTKHDVIAFLTNLEESIGDLSAYVHIGMTSSDVLDTSFAVQIKQAGKILLDDLEKLSSVLKRRANEFKYLPAIGRTHGVHAEPITFGLKFALWYDECTRNIERLKFAMNDVCIGKINGAVGTFEHLSPKVEEYVCKELGLKPALITNQVIQRDHHAYFIDTLAIIGTMLEKIATELRHLQRTEVLEAEEYFTPGQKGSSAMPHKRNPISAENITGQARLLRGYAVSAMENNALWHERDISHSSVERVIFPDATVTLDYILNRTTKLLDKLIVYPENISKNLYLTHGLIFSQKVLLALTNKGMPRQEAYELVQKSALKSWQEKSNFKDNLLQNEQLLKYLTKEEIDKQFNFDEIFEKVDYIYNRLGI
ncbi:MAG TPA: adenylosuccinate lyase [Candidatus Kapabacteria bacterium]|nr:adenylosuccinate lyase [Candidatus Kapabacteria bacterium]